eukprot:6534891-Prymnesium_polylepis.1
MKDQKRRAAEGQEEPPPAEEEKPPPAGAPARRKGAAEQKKPMKRGAHQIFTAAEATRMLCNGLFDLMKEHAQGFYGVEADCVDNDIHVWRVKIRR